MFAFVISETTSDNRIAGSNLYKERSGTLSGRYLLKMLGVSSRAWGCLFILEMA